jgi:hypothetical protein
MNFSAQAGSYATKTTDVSFSNGTIKVPPGTLNAWNGTTTFSSNPLGWPAPGAKIMIVHGLQASGHDPVYPNSVNTGGMVTAFVALDVYTDSSQNYCVDTTMESLPTITITFTATISGTTMHVTAINSPSDACLIAGMIITGGGLPAGTKITGDLSIPNSTNNLGNYTINNSATISTSTTFTTSADLVFFPHYCPRFTVISCTGARAVTDMAGAPPDIPMFSYFKRAFAGSPGYPAYYPQNYVYLQGNLISWEINVIKPYTGTSSTYTCLISLFGWKHSGNNYWPVWLNQTIDLKVAGTRTITSTNFSGNVGGDVLSAVPFWLGGSYPIVMSPTTSEALGVMPFFIMTGRTHQGAIEATSIAVTNATSGLDTLSECIMGPPVGI